MMPGLLPTNGLSLSVASSSSRAAERGAFPKPFNERVLDVESSVSATGGPSTNLPHGTKPLRAIHNPMAQAMKPVLLPSRLNPAREVTMVDAQIDTHLQMPEWSSSGSDHDPSSVCLAAMVDEFMENGGKARESGDEPSNCLERAKSKGFAEICTQLQSLQCCNNELKVIEELRDDVQTIVESVYRSSVCACSNNKNGCRRRMVMRALQRIGYDAAICKTKWDHSGSLPAGDYEYIDVVSASQASAADHQPCRLLVDIDFQAQFDIARPSDEFTLALQLLPPIFVGRHERLLQILHIMAEAVKQSLAVKRMHLPPWRKLDYMKAKWFSAYKRTTSTNSRRSTREAPLINHGSVGAGIAATGYGKLDQICMNQLGRTCHDDDSELPDLTVDGRGPFTAKSDFITVMTTEWEPPPVESRPDHSWIRSQSKVTGLASMLHHVPSNVLPPWPSQAAAEAA